MQLFATFDWAYMKVPGEGGRWGKQGLNSTFHGHDYVKKKTIEIVMLENREKEWCMEE